MAYYGWVYVTTGSGGEDTAREVATVLGGTVIDLPGSEWGVVGLPIDVWVNDVVQGEGLEGFTHSLMVKNRTTSSYAAQDAAARTLFDQLVAATPWRVALVNDDGRTVIEDRPARTSAS